MYHNNLYIHSSSFDRLESYGQDHKRTKNEKEIGYYQWNHDQMDSFLDITTFTYHGDRYETADGGGDGAMSFGYLEASMKGRKPAFWLKETMNQTDQKDCQNHFLVESCSRTCSMHFHQTVAVIWSFLIQVIKP